MSTAFKIDLSKGFDKAMSPGGARIGIINGSVRIGNALVDAIQEGIRGGPATGRIYNFRGRKHQASAPGEYPANRTGDLAGSIKSKLLNATSFEVGSDGISYAPILQQFPSPDVRSSDWSKIAPRPFLTLAHDQVEPQFIPIASNRTK